MPMVRAMRMLNAIEAGTLSGAQLQNLLTGDPGRLAEFNALLGMRGQARRLCASQTALVACLESPAATTRLFSNPVSNEAAGSSSSLLMAALNAASMNAVVASSTAMNAVVASSTAMNAVVASSTAMNAVAASSTAMNVVAASSTAMNVVAASSTAMNVVAASSTAMNAVVASSTAMNAVMANPTALSLFYTSDHFAPNRERIYPFHLASANGGGLNVIDASGLGKHSMAAGTAVLVSGPNEYQVWNGSANYGPTVPQIGLTHYTITAVLALTSNTDVALLGVAGDDGIVITQEGQALLITNVDTVTQTIPLSPAIPTNGSTYVVLQYRTNNSTGYVRINNWNETSANGKSSLLDGALTLGFGELVTTNVFAAGLRCAELIVTTDPTNTAELGRIRTALASKYGITL